MSLRVCPTGVPGLDEVVGGLYYGQIVVVAGGPGTGKTVLAAKFVHEGARRFGDPGLYISTCESRDEFMAYMRGLGINFEDLEAKKMFKFVELLTPTSTEDLMVLSKALMQNALELKARRIVIDSFTPYTLFRPPIEVRAIMHNALKPIARMMSAVMILVLDVPTGSDRIGAGVEEFIADCVILLRSEVNTMGRQRRVMRILKLRGKELMRVSYEFEISPEHVIRVLH